MLSVKEHLHSELDGQSVFHNFGTEATQIWNTWLNAENSTQQGEVEVFMFLMTVKLVIHSYNS